MRIAISASKTVNTLWLCVVVLTAASLAGQYAKFMLEHSRVLGLVNLFDLHLEANLPTWYSSAALLSCAVLLAAIAVCERAADSRFSGYWTGLAVIFLLMAIDETASLHERTIKPMRAILPHTSWFYYSWVVLALVLLFVFAAVYFRFVMALPQKSRSRFVAAGIIFVFGAVGVESFGGRYEFLHGNDDFRYALLSTVEELCEMSGIVLFIRGLLLHLQTFTRRGPLGIEVAD